VNNQNIVIGVVGGIVLLVIINQFFFILSYKIVRTRMNEEIMMKIGGDAEQ
jgi:hypothetical protein